MTLCRSCRAPIVWAITEAGRRMPVDADPSAGGSVVLIDGGERGLLVRVLRKGEHAAPGEATHKPHHQTCPQGREWHRRSKT